MDSVPCWRERCGLRKSGQGTGLGGTQENAQKISKKSARNTGLNNSRCHAGKCFLQEFPCIHVLLLLSDDSTKQEERGEVMKT